MLFRSQMIQALNEKNTDRQIERDAIDKKFEAQLLGIVAKFEAAQAATQEKAVASYNAHIGSRIDDLAQGVNTLREDLANPKKEKKDG